MASSKAVLSDLGIAAFVKDEEAMQKRVGSPGYAPPEVVTDLPYDEKVDVFGAGAVLYFALSNTLPFPGKTLKKVLELTAKCKVSWGLFLWSWLWKMGNANAMDYHQIFSIIREW